MNHHTEPLNQPQLIHKYVSQSLDGRSYQLSGLIKNWGHFTNTLYSGMIPSRVHPTPLMSQTNHFQCYVLSCRNMDVKNIVLANKLSNTNLSFPILISSVWCSISGSLTTGSAYPATVCQPTPGRGKPEPR